jgi:hypothetical protein
MLDLHLELNHIAGDMRRAQLLKVHAATILCEIRDTAQELRKILRRPGNFDSVVHRKTRTGDVTVHMHRYDLPDHEAEDEEDYYRDDGDVYFSDDDGKDFEEEYGDLRDSGDGWSGQYPSPCPVADRIGF